ncbi:MAG: hypothetical protein IJR54_08710 [Oscillibacter sp.]|nr:hypothetical protein [Oscillibacter sp.]
MSQCYGDLKRRVLELINRYSVAGETISPAYNNQSDDILRIPGLINDALLRIRTEACPRVVTCSFSHDFGQRYGDRKAYILPDAFRGIKTGGVYRDTGSRFEPFGDYRLLGERMILFPDDGATYVVEYYRAPECLPENPADGYDMSEEPEALTAACYYAAAMLIADRNEYRHTTLYNEFLRRMEGMVRQPTAEISTVVDVYG